MRLTEDLYVVNSGDNNLTEYCSQVVKIINDFVKAPNTRGEMLVPKSESLAEAYRKGDGVMLANKNGQVRATCTFWELINLQNSGIALYELGSWIVDRGFRHLEYEDVTIGEYTARILLTRVQERGAGVIATVKRLNSYRGLKHIGAEPISYADYPYITGLTCVCPASSEYVTGASCQHRRTLGAGESRNGSGNIVDVEYLLDSSDSPKIPCTLVGFDVPRLRQINHQLGQEHANHGDVNYVGLDKIEVPTMRGLQGFYSGLGVNL